MRRYASMMSATVAFSVGRTGSGGTAVAGVGCVRKNLIAVGPVRKHDRVSEQRIIPITADLVTPAPAWTPWKKRKNIFFSVHAVSFVPAFVIESVEPHEEGLHQETGQR